VVVDWGRIEIGLVVQIVQHLMKTQHDDPTFDGGLWNSVVDYRVTCCIVV